MRKWEGSDIEFKPSMAVKFFSKTFSCDYVQFAIILLVDTRQWSFVCTNGGQNSVLLGTNTRKTGYLAGAATTIMSEYTEILLTDCP